MHYLLNNMCIIIKDTGKSGQTFKCFWDACVTLPLKRHQDKFIPVQKTSAHGSVLFLLCVLREAMGKKDFEEIAF